PSIGSMTPCRSLSLTQEEKERREDQIHQDHQKDGNHHGTRRGTPDLLGAGPCRQPFVTSHRRYRNPEHGALDESRNDIAQEKRVDGRANVSAEHEVRPSHAKERSAENPHGVGADRQTRQHDKHREKLRGHQKANRIDRHGFERVDLLGYLHGSYFSGERRPGSSDDDDGGDQWPELP